MRPSRIGFVVFLLLFFIDVSVCRLNAQSLQSKYQFRETIELINFVDDAADHFTENGTVAFLDFGIPDSKWYKEHRYIFVYDLEGSCVFHPVQKELVGKNVLHIKDMNGKPIIQFILNIAADSTRTGGWVHYLWADRGEFFPSWKSAYIKRVKSLDGKYYALGSGTYDIRSEKEFMIEMVDSAANLLKSEGETAYKKLIDKSTIFYFSDIYIFVISMEGKAIIDPAFPDISGRNLLNFQDKVGKYVVVDMIEILQNKDKARVVYIWPQPGQSIPTKKLAYIRKVNVNGEDVIVGSSLFIVEPIWHRF